MKSIKYLLLCCTIFSAYAEDFTFGLSRNLPEGRLLSSQDLIPVRLNPVWHITQTKHENWQKRLPGKAILCRIGERIDLDTILPGNQTEGSECILYNEFESPEAGLAQLGIGCDWWFQAYVNGHKYASTMQEGNGTPQYAASNHPFLLKLKQGKNLLAVRVRRGSLSWLFCCSAIPFQLPQWPLLTCGPWLANPDAGRMSIRFCSYGRLGGGVEYRKRGTNDWQTVFDQRLGQIRRERYHQIHLQNLAHGIRYEYRVFLLDPRAPERRIYPECGNVHTFRVPDLLRNSFSFFFTADLQFQHKKQQKILEKLLDAACADSCDFIVFGGDIGSAFNNMEHDMLDRIVSTLVRRGGAERPLIALRGNHELRGLDSERFLDFFGTPDGVTYGIFRFGDTAFLMLDSWEDKPSDSPMCAYTKYNIDSVIVEQQKTFLQRAMNSPEWTNAKRKIVLCHGAPYSHKSSCDKMPLMLQALTDPYFRGHHPRHRIQLWLAGHIHHYSRSIPFSDEIAALSPPQPPHTGGLNYGFPVLTVAGPGSQPEASAFRVDVKPEVILVKAYSPNGALLDSVEIRNDGTILERMKLPHFRFPTFSEKEKLQR